MRAEVLEATPLAVSQLELDGWRAYAIDLQLGEIRRPLEMWTELKDPDYMLQLLTERLKLGKVPHRLECDAGGRVWIELRGPRGWERITRKVGELVG